METLDLNINHYSLNDLLNLFHLNRHFNKNDLKQVYKKVLMTHPDKSKLDKKYFLFFSKAFKLIKQIYDNTNKKEECVERKIYEPNINETIDTSKINTKEFNKKFNNLFEKVKIHDEEYDTGYEEWLKSEKDIENIHTTKNNMNDAFELLKKKQKENMLICHKGIEELQENFNGHSNLVREKPQEYSSNLFSKLKYEDVKKAHTETVVPVTEEDYYTRERFNNVNELNQYRKQNEIIPSEREQQDIFQTQKNIEYELNIQRNFQLMKQMEEIEKSHSIWNANFKQLLDK